MKQPNPPPIINSDNLPDCLDSIASLCDQPTLCANCWPASKLALFACAIWLWSLLTTPAHCLEGLDAHVHLLPTAMSPATPNFPLVSDTVAATYRPPILWNEHNSHPRPSPSPSPSPQTSTGQQHYAATIPPTLRPTSLRVVPQPPLVPEPTSSSKGPPTEAVALCPTWDPHFSLHFQQTCKVWINRIDDWRKKLKGSRSQPVQYSCIHESQCNGIGDRFSGIHSVLEAAIDNDRPMRIRWHDLQDVFEPTCLMPQTWVPQPTDKYKLTCQWPKRMEEVQETTCAPVDNMCVRPKNGVQVFNYIKGCPSADVCKVMRDELLGVKKGALVKDRRRNLKKDRSSQSVVPASGTVAHVFGCAMRAMFQVTQQFLDFRVSWINNREATSISIGQVAALMRQYFTISIHFRLGDRAFHGDKVRIAEHWDRYGLMFECAQSVERYVLDHGINQGRPVKWVFSSDSATMREFALQEYGDKVMMVGERPQHLAEADAPATKQTMAEWYLLSLGDRLVVNRVNSANYRELYTGRLSGFAKTLWAYQLKHLYYDGGTCQLRSMRFDGSWNNAQNKICTRLSYELEIWKLPQPHRKYGKWGKLSKGELPPGKVADAYSDDMLFEDTARRRRSPTDAVAAAATTPTATTTTATSMADPDPSQASLRLSNDGEVVDDPGQIGKQAPNRVDESGGGGGVSGGEEEKDDDDDEYSEVDNAGD